MLKISSFLLILSIFVMVNISNGLKSNYFTAGKRISSHGQILHRVQPLNEAQSFTSFDDMLTKIDRPVLVDFFALWCGPCKMMVPVLEDLAGRMENELKVAKVDTDKYPRLGSRFQIEALPTLILFNKGEVVDRYLGYMDADALEAAVRKSLAKVK